MAEVRDYLEVCRRAAYDESGRPQFVVEQRSGRVLSANAAFLALLGKAEGAVLGRTTVELGFWPDEGRRNSFLSCLAIEGLLSRYPLDAPGRLGFARIFLTVRPIALDGEVLLYAEVDTEDDRSAGDPAELVRFLARSATRFLMAEDEEVYAHVASSLLTLMPHSVLVACSFDEGKDTLSLRSLAGPEEVLALVEHTASEYRGGVVGVLDEPMMRRLKEGLLWRDRAFDGPSGGSSPFLPLLRPLGIRSVWNIGIPWDGRLYGLVSVLVRDPDALPDHSLVETLVLQAAVALQRNQSFQALEASVAEKDTLLREIHHRVKNNLQVVSSLLKLQMDYAERRGASEVLAEAADRVQSMALVHTLLYGSARLSTVDADEYIRTLVGLLFRGARWDLSAVEIIFELEKLSLDPDRAVSLGLIVNELVTNALKYGVGLPGPGKLSVRLSARNGSGLLVVSDTGCRLPEGFDPGTTDSLGLQLVLSLCRQLGGGLSVSAGETTDFCVHFPIEGVM